MRVFQFLEKKISDPRHNVMAVWMKVVFQHTWQGGVLSHEHLKSLKQAHMAGNDHAGSKT
jgi:hypothetical protein